MPLDDILAESLAPEPPARASGHSAAPRADATGLPLAAIVGLLNVGKSVLLERAHLLADLLATEDGQVHPRACELQHALHDGLDDRICTLLGRPSSCPHGRAIPRGDCCREMRKSVGRVIAPLSDLQPGERGRIAYLHRLDPRRLEELIAMGVLPGVPIRLIRRYPSVTFEAGYSQSAIDEETAADLSVRLIPE